MEEKHLHHGHIFIDCNKSATRLDKKESHLHKIQPYPDAERRAYAKKKKKC